jgi:hypothetical protein
MEKLPDFCMFCDHWTSVPTRLHMTLGKCKLHDMSTLDKDICNKFSTKLPIQDPRLDMSQYVDAQIDWVRERLISEDTRSLGTGVPPAYWEAEQLVETFCKRFPGENIPIISQ